MMDHTDDPLSRSEGSGVCYGLHLYAF
jgi:hypothetical protein